MTEVGRLARVLDGRKVAAQIEAEIAPGAATFTRQHGRPPCLAILLVGDDPASEVYVRNKERSGLAAGFRVDVSRLPDTTTLDETLAAVDRLNQADHVDGILVQAPLPVAMGARATQQIFDAIAPEKDVDGFGAESVGLLSQNRPTLVACTPSGIIELLDREGIPISGTQAIVVGRSDIVGKPMALLLLHRDATVTIAHSRTRDLPDVCRRADIVVAAVGRPGLVRKDFIKPGATVIDVGMNQVTDPQVVADLYPAGHPRSATFRAKGSLLVGDVHPAVAEVAGALTPVPGGVGPLTIAMLMTNTLKAAIGRTGGST
jgi:methylenetetrahydrofolate dehydrogenase (NADP+)/methenyltetrahydrofolate cyclohydrolase